MTDPDDIYHAQTGRPLIRPSGPHLEDDPDLWEEVWANARDALLADWIDGAPGTRPPAWWRFDTVALPDRGDEPEPDFLHRLGLLEPAELEAIRREVLTLVEYDRCRSPRMTPAGYYPDHWIPPSDLHRFAARIGLLDESERQALLLDERGESTVRLVGSTRNPGKIR